MTRFDERASLVQPLCPKRLWVLWSLSDDEYANEGDAPRGLKFHLSRCPSCRMLAESLSDTTARLNQLSLAAAPARLFEAAQGQALAALRDGGQPTGRITLGTEPEAWSDSPARAAPHRMLARFAAAAVVLLTVGAVSYVQLRGGESGPKTKPLSASLSPAEGRSPYLHHRMPHPSSAAKSALSATRKEDPYPEAADSADRADDLREILERDPAWFAHRARTFHALTPRRPVTDPNLDKTAPAVLSSKP